MQVVTMKGQFIQRKFTSDPFAGKVQTDAETQDERDWNQFVKEKREMLNDPTWDPVTIQGKSTHDIIKKARDYGV